MEAYQKIQTMFMRDMDSKGRILEGQWTLPEFEYLSKNIWIFTEKIDGSNIRVTYRAGKIAFAGKNDHSQIHSPLLESYLSEKFLPLLDKFQEIFTGDVCLYGEGYGSGIQKGGGNYRKDQSFVLFDIKVGDWWLRRSDLENIAEKLAIDTVPIIGMGTLYDALAKAKLGFESSWGRFEAEGLVAKPKIELRSRNGERIITKIKCRDFRA